MAAEIEEPLGFDFRTDSFHSGSVSFGRFESEDLCWERRSSFSHNRYLEDVEKCSKPGSVTEKKAYFEAHFRKKRFGLCLNETDDQVNQNNTSEKTSCNDEEIDHMNASTCSAKFDSSLDGSVHGGNHEITECEPGVCGPLFVLAGDSISNVDYIPDNVTVSKADDTEFRSAASMNFEPGIGMKENYDGETAEFVASLEEISNSSPKDQRSSSPNEKIPSKSEHIKQRLIARVSAGRSRRYTSPSTSRGSKDKANNNVWNVPVRSKAEKKTSEEPKKSLMQKTNKLERGSKTKQVEEINSAEPEKDRRNRTIVEPMSSTSQKGSRAYQRTNRVKPIVGVPKPGTSLDISRSSFKSGKRAQRMKESDMKLESKMHSKAAEMHQRQAKTQAQPEPKQFRKNPSFKALPLPSFYRAALCAQDGNKATPSNTEPRKQHAKPSDFSQAGTSLTNRKREPEKESLKVYVSRNPKTNQIHKGKLFDAKQKTRIGRSRCTSFNTSSRAVGVAS